MVFIRLCSGFHIRVPQSCLNVMCKTCNDLCARIGFIQVFFGSWRAVNSRTRLLRYAMWRASCGGGRTVAMPASGTVIRRVIRRSLAGHDIDPEGINPQNRDCRTGIQAGSSKRSFLAIASYFKNLSRHRKGYIF